MKQTISRRSFFKVGSVAAMTGIAATPWTGWTSPASADEASPVSKDWVKVGMAGYSLNRFKLEPALEILKQVDVHYLCIKDFHLPLKSTEEEIAAFHAKCREYGVQGYGVGPIYMGSEDEARQAFAYARRVGVKLVVGVPFTQVEGRRAASRELLKVINDLVQEYDFKYAIHNHGPDMPDLFPTAESAMELIGGLDKRVGLCLDIGHQLRDGKDPNRALAQFADRVHDIHLKNVTAPTRQGRSIELHRGVIDLVEFVRVLKRIQYPGVCSLEHEKDMDKPVVGIAESIGYFRGLLAALA